MRLLIFGASGKTGSEIVRQALDKGHSVSAFVRDPSRLSVEHSSLRVLAGNVGEAAVIAEAVVGQDAVVSALGVGVPLKHDEDVIAGIRNIVRAMEDQAVFRFIYLSFIGVRESRHAAGFVLRYVAPLPLRHEIADHELKEEVVRGSRLDWTIVRPPKLTVGPRTGTYRSGENISTGKLLPTLSRADVADFILQELADPRYVRKAPRLLP